jgi:hypothetical protein
MRIQLLLWSSLVISCTAGPALAQQEPPKDPAPAPAALPDRVTELERMVNSLYESNRKLMLTSTDVSKVVEENTKSLEDLAQQVEELKSDLAEKDAELREILDAIASRDSAGKPVLALRNIMQSDDFKQEFQGAVNEALETHGTFTVENETYSEQLISVNGSTHTVPARMKATFRVPVGTVTSQLVGQEAAKNWTIAAPSYTMGIKIRPTVIESSYVLLP